MSRVISQLTEFPWSWDEAVEYLGRIPCCPADNGGSHWHCENCGDLTSMYGHATYEGFSCQKRPWRKIKARVVQQWILATTQRGSA